MKNNREKIAVNAYLKLLKNKGASSGTLYKRSLFLDKLTMLLAGKELDRAVYSNALDSALSNIATADRDDCFNIAREFYPFWQNDIKAIATFNLYYGFNSTSIKWKPPPASLEALTKNLDNEKFDDNEKTALKLYVSALRGRGAGDLVIETRIKMAKIVLVRLRDAPECNSKIYRMAVDITLPLFTVQEIRQLFLQVVREFYYSWNVAIRQSIC